MGRFTINKALWPMKAHYFLYNAGTAPVTPFLSVYARQMGFSGFIVGIFYTVMPFSGMIAKPLVGAIADRYKCQKKIFLSMVLVTMAAFISLLYVPKMDENESKVHFSCHYGESVFDTCLSNETGDATKGDFLEAKLQSLPNITEYCKLSCPLDENSWTSVFSSWGKTEYQTSHPANLEFTAHVPLYLALKLGKLNCLHFRVTNATLPSGRVVPPMCLAKETVSAICNATCTSHKLNELLPKSMVSDKDVVKYYQFWVFLALMVIGWIGQAIVVSVSDAVCFELLGDKPNRYGYQRCFGSLGWGIFSIIAGVVLDATSENAESKNYTGVFFLSAALLLIDFGVSSRIKYSQKILSASILRDVSRLLADIRIFVFALWCIVMGICTALVWNFLFWLLENLAQAQGMLQWIKTLEGIAMSIQCLGGELPLFFLSGYILKRIGHVHAMTLIMLMMGLRLVLYSILTNPWWVLPIEFLNGVTFGLFYACMASYASIVAPPGTATTVQGLVGAMFEGIGVSIGSFLAGYLNDRYGDVSITFRIIGIMALVASLVHFVVQYLLARRTSKDMGRYAAPEDSNYDIFAYDQQELKLVEAY